MAQLPDLDHDCEGGGDAVGGVIMAQQKASSSCCGAVLAEGGTPATGFTCTQCGQPCELVLGEWTDHWTCHCGVRRSQVKTQPVDHPAES